MSITPFRISISDEEIQDLGRRLQGARMPAGIPGAHWAMGMDADYLRRLLEYWRQGFSWRSVEAQLNELPQFITDTAQGAVHFVHFRGVGPSPLPIVLTHGWPSTFVELVELGRALANPRGEGRAGALTFDVVIPSLPGFIFSAAPTSLGTNFFTIASQWVELMNSLGYRRFFAHGGDLGAGVSTALGLKHSDHVLGLHLNYIPGSFSPAQPLWPELSPEESSFLVRRAAWLDEEGGYARVQATKPDVLGPALDDAPVGLAAWIIDKYRSWSDCNGDVETRFTRDQLLTAVCLYWFTRSMPTAIRLYWEIRRRPLVFGQGDRVVVPTAVAHFPQELPIPPRSYVERGFNVQRWTEFQRGGHFAAHEQTAALAADIRAFVVGSAAREK